MGLTYNYKKYQMKLLIGCVLLMIPTLIIAQVTIGSTLKPVTGSLLDLKQYASTTNVLTNATAGLLLPRVQLTQLDKLYPMFLENDPEYMGDKILEQNAHHVGLIVYNIKDASTNIESGLYFWDGVKWKGVSEKDEVDPETDENIVLDHENNDYLIGEFGRAGWWTLQNARPKTLPNGQKILFSKEVDKDDPNKTTIVKIFYPDGEPNTEEMPSTHDEKKYGMLYTRSAALAEQLSVPAGSYIRGLCPVGWHVPTDADWLLLEKELYDNFNKYSNRLEASNIGNWESYWESPTSEGYRGRFGQIFKSTEKVIRDSGSIEGEVKDPKGYSKPASEGGFDAYLVGGHQPGRIENQGAYDLHYGVVSQFWSSSPWPAFPVQQSVRKFSETELGMHRGYRDGSFLVSLRCKKDN